MQLRRILVPTDFSEFALAAVEAAASMAAASGGRLTLQHVHPIVEVVVLEYSYVQPPERVAEALDAARSRLVAMAAKLDLPTERIDIMVTTGQPAHEIIAASKAHDLVVMPTHGRTGLSHFMLGSVAERVVQGAACSVLVVKTPRP